MVGSQMESGTATGTGTGTKSGTINGVSPKNTPLHKNTPSPYSGTGWGKGVFLGQFLLIFVNFHERNFRICDLLEMEHRLSCRKELCDEQELKHLPSNFSDLWDLICESLSKSLLLKMH